MARGKKNEKYGGMRAWGWRAAGSASASRLKEMRVRVSRPPGKKANHQALSRLSLPAATMLPQDGVGGRIPSPR